MAIDKARLHKLHLESRALLDSVADRLPAERVQHLRTLSDVGEWMHLVNGICASLVMDQILITPDERDALATVLTIYPPPGGRFRYMNDIDGTLAALNIVQ
jgi:hypothetical protein